MTELSYAIKRSISLVLVLAAAFLAFTLSASADGYAEITAPDQVPWDNEFSIRVTFSADSPIGTARCTLGYSEQDIEFVSSQYASGGGGFVNINAFPQSLDTELTVTLTFKALQTGTSALTLTNGSVMSPDGVMLAGGITADAFVTVSDTPSDSAESEASLPDDSVPDALRATLASLTVTTGELVPAFSPGIYAYTVTVPHEVEYLGIDAEPAGKYDTIWFEGSEYLADGSTLRTVTVTTADGTVSNVYTVNIIRLTAEESIDPDESQTSEPGLTDESAENTDALSAADSLTVSMQSSGNSVAPRVRTHSSVADSEPETLRDRLMPLLIGVMAVIVLLAAFLVIRIRTRSKNKLR